MRAGLKMERGLGLLAGVFGFEELPSWGLGEVSLWTLPLWGRLCLLVGSDVWGLRQKLDPLGLKWLEPWPWARMKSGLEEDRRVRLL